jgi:hypothetical protein
VNKIAGVIVEPEKLRAWHGDFEDYIACALGLTPPAI